MNNSLYILVCSYFVRDVKAALALDNKFDKNIKVIGYTPDCGSPPLDWESIDKLIPSTDSACDILLLGSACLNAIGKEIKNNKAASCYKKVVYFEQCFHLISPPELIDDALAKGYYLLNPGWLAGWHKKIKQWGFNQQGTQNFIDGSINKLLLIDTKVDKHSAQQLQEFSEYIARPEKVYPLGLKYLYFFLSYELNLWFAYQLKRKQAIENKATSNYAMSLDLIAQLSHNTSESEVIDGIINIFSMLFAADELIFIPYVDGQAGKPTFAEHINTSTIDLPYVVPEFIGEYMLCDDSGFWLRLERRNELLGMLKVNKIALPQYRTAYLNQALNIISVCALVIDNARTVSKLVDTAHLAGKAELAIEVLHNVGNVLNSINVSSQMIMERLQQSVSTRMPAVVDIMEQQHENIGEFINSDPRGQKLPAFFSLISKELEKERKLIQEDINRLFMNVEHIKGIIRTQQVYSRESNLLERVNLIELMDEALMLYDDKIKQYKIHIEKYYMDLGLLELPKHKLLQIVSNLISNAIDSLISVKSVEYKIELRMQQQEEQVIIEVEDNGTGIDLEKINQIFNHGFTTKSNHSGFGLHSAANLSAEMGGKLTVSSGGKGNGACFRLVFPLPKNSRE